MKIKNIMRLGAVLFLCGQGIQASAETSLWTFCDICVGDSDFRHHATQVTVDGTIYVSNRSTNTTRKFQRWTTYEDFSDGVVQMTHVFESPMETQEKNAFNQVINNADTGFAQINREELEQYGAGEAGSGLDDLGSDGGLFFSFLNGVTAHVVNLGLFPSESAISSELGGTVKIISGNYANAHSRGIRVAPLVIQVDYADGSMIQMQLSPDATTFSQITLTDMNGEKLQITGQNENGETRITVSGFADKEFFFGASDAAALRLFDFINGQSGGSLSCITEAVAKGFRVACQRQH